MIATKLRKRVAGALLRLEEIDRYSCRYFDRHFIRWSALSLVFALLISLPSNWYQADQLVSERTNVLDGSFEITLPARMIDGEFSSRDFIYSYGPAYQVLHGIPVLLGSRESAQIWRWKGFFSSVLLVILLWHVVSRTGAPGLWRSCVLVFWCGWLDLLFKPWGLILSMTLVGHATGQQSMKPRRAQRDIAFFCVAFSIVFISMLYSFDFGPFLALGTTVFCVVVISAANRNGPTARSLRRRAVLLSMAVAFGLLSSIIAVFSWADAPEIVPDLIDLLVGYRITMNKPFPAARYVLGWGICGIVSIGSIFWIHRELRAEMNRKAEFFQSIAALTLLLAATVFSAVWLGYGLTRSDPFHVKLACMPAVFSVGLLLPCYLRTRKVKYALIFGGLGLPLVIGTCYIERPENPIDRISSMLTFDLRGAEWKVTAAAIGAGIDAAQGQHTQSLFVWPYQTVVSSILGRRDPLHTVQAHMATTRRLDHRNVESLKSRHSLSALLLMDSWKIDGIPNPSRSPAVFHYLLTRFDLSEAPKHHAALLERRLAGERVFNVFSLPVPQRGESLGGGLVLDIEEYDVRATDVLWLRIRATEGTRIPLSRPGRLRILVHLSNGQIHNNPYLVRGDGESEHLLLETVSPTNDLVLSPFLPGPRRLRSMETVDRIEMTWEPLGLLSGSQPEIRFEGLEAWRVLSGSIKTVSLEAQPPNEFWSWVFADEPVKGEKGNPSADSSDGNGS